jgi:hypothetical protein
MGSYTNLQGDDAKKAAIKDLVSRRDDVTIAVVRQELGLIQVEAERIVLAMEGKDLTRKVAAANGYASNQNDTWQLA